MNNKLKQTNKKQHKQQTIKHIAKKKNAAEELHTPFTINESKG